MTFNQPNMIMLKNLIGFCEDNNCIVKSITNHAGDKEYDISLTWIEPRHDGSKCKKLTIDDGWKPVHNLTCVTDPAITRMELDVQNQRFLMRTTRSRLKQRKSR